MVLRKLDVRILVREITGTPRNLILIVRCMYFLVANVRDGWMGQPKSEHWICKSVRIIGRSLRPHCCFVFLAYREMHFLFVLIGLM